MKVILIAAISANGQIAQKVGQNSLDWTSKEDTRFFIEKTKEIGVMIMGRRTFETIGKPLKGRRLIVLSESVCEPKEGVEFVKASAREILDRLEKEGVAQVAICGGATVYGDFLRQGLVTDVFLSVESVMFGSGIPLAVGFDRIDMRLVEVKRLGESTALLHYKLDGNN